MVDLHRDVTWAILIPPFPGSNPGAPANECAGRRLFGDPKEMGECDRSRAAARSSNAECGGAALSQVRMR